MSIEPQLTPEQIKQISKQVKKSLYKTIGRWIGILIAIFGFSLFQIWREATKKIENVIVDRITNEFKEPKIHKTVENVAKTTAKEMLTDDIQPEVIKFKADIKLSVNKIEELVNSAQSQVDNLKNKSEEYNKKLENINNELTEATKVNKDLKVLSNFMLTFIKAQSDDSEAFEQLAVWGLDKSSPFYDFSLSLYETIRRYYSERLNPRYHEYNWSNNMKPSEFTLSDFNTFLLNVNINPRYHAHLVNLIWETSDIPKKDRMQFLIDVLNKSKSLNARDFAARFLSTTSEINLKWDPFIYPPLIDKWESVKDTIK